MNNTQANLREVLLNTFGREWLRLSHADQELIIRDCQEDGGVSDFAQYRKDIGMGHLESYARVMRVRFAK